MPNIVARPSQNPSDITRADLKTIYAHLRRARPEAKKIQNKMDELSSAYEQIRELEDEKATKGKSSGGVIFLLFCLCIIAPFIYCGYKSSVRKRCDRDIRAIMEEIAYTESEIEKLIRESEYLPLLPNGYRTFLAVDTMIGYIENGRADSWKECTALFEEQKHRWKIEQNSEEALQYQAFAALAAQSAASSANVAAVGSTISAISSILSWF
jgi:hypothetical protein